MKKYIALLLLASVLFSFASCGSGEEASSATSEIPSETESATESGEEKSEIMSEDISMEESSAEVDRTWPTVCGTFVQPGSFVNYDVKKWVAHFNNLLEVGINIFIIQWTAETPYGKFLNVYYPSEYAKSHKASTFSDYSSFLPNVLEAAEKTGIKVFVGLNLSDEWWSQACSNVSWNKTVSGVGVEMAKEIYSLYKEQFPNALYGWYFAYEMFNGMQNQEQKAGEFLNMYLEPLTELDASMPLMLSPFVSNWGSTAEKAEQEWKKVFEYANFREGDIFCCQDAVGAGHITINQLASYFSALKAAVDTEEGLHFWANSEDFTTDYNSAYVGRFIRQMQIAEPYVENYVTFAYSHYYAKDYNGKGGFHRAYKHYYDTGETKVELDEPEVTYEIVDGKAKLTAKVMNTEAGIQKITFSAKGSEDYVYEIPVSRLKGTSFTAHYVITPDEGQTSVKVTVTVTDYYGTERSNIVEIKFN